MTDRPAQPVDDDLTEERRELLAHLLREEGIEADVVQALPRREEAAEIPLSFPQRQLRFLHQLDPECAGYNVLSAYRLTGPLDVSALRRAFDEIVRRHESLRTSFPLVEGRPLQVVADSIAFDMPIADLPADAGEEQLRRLAVEEAHRCFDLSHGLPLRTRLLRLGEQDHVLLLTMHHIVSDAWSNAILCRELSELYGAFAAGRPSPLTDLPVQYAEFALWQHSSIAGERLKLLLDYWREQLRDAPAALKLPADRPRPPVQTFRGARHAVALPGNLSDALGALGRGEHVTLFMVLLAGFYTLLHRTTGQEDIVVGSPIANRNRPDFERLIGFFANTIALRTDLSGNPTFRELLARVRTTTLGAYEHQDLPFERIVEEIAPRRDLARNPIFQVVVALQNAPASPLELADLSVERMEVDPGTTVFDLTMSLQTTPEGLRGFVEYTTDLFDAETIGRMAARFLTLLQSVAANPDQPLSQERLLPDGEHRQLTVDFNATAREYPRSRCIHELFEEQAAQRPEAIAVVYGEGGVTYGELNTRANRLARRLLSLGVGQGTFVGILMERSPDMIAGMLAVLKAGGAYVSLDPAYPAERLRLMLRDTGARVVIADEALRETLPAEVDHVLVPGEEPPDSATNLSLEISPEIAAYVMYTSGSTGTPKGVVTPHRGVTRLLFGVDYVRLDPDCTVLHVAPPTFDASTFEVWAPLLHGGTCVVLRDRTPTLSALRSAIEDNGVNTMWLTASYFNTVVDEAPQTLAGVRQLLTGGEALSGPHVRRALDLLPGTQIVNGYGPTESTTFACCHPIPRDFPAVSQTVPIGRPIANTVVRILDAHRQLAPIGVPGELCIGGDGLAIRYLNDTELTSERFINDPFSDRPEARLYLTGDLARFRGDGVIEFLGRLDDQVKIRGFRVEPGEVEVRLRSCAGVREAVVVAQRGASGDKRLSAYVTLDPAAGGDIAPLRESLAQTLPEYMLPEAYVILDRLPLLPNGKVDRSALPAPDTDTPAPPDARVPPRNALEEVLARIWAEVLRVEWVGVHDDFFALGGHSLLAMRAMFRVTDTLRVEAPLRDLFRAPTVSGLAAALLQAAGDQAAVLERTAELVLRVADLPEEHVDGLLEGNPAGNCDEAGP